MARAMGRRSRVAARYNDQKQPLRAVAIVQLLQELRRDSAEQTLFAIAELDYYEERLLRAITRQPSISSTT